MEDFVSIKRAVYRVSGVLAVAASVALTGCNGEDNPVGGGGNSDGFGAVDPKSVVRGEVADPRDGKRYKTVKIGVQTWMAENLNYATATTNTDSSWCYDDNNSNCATYGRLYNLDAAKNACLGLGGGWHLPDAAEWDRLVADVSGVFDVTVKDAKGNVFEHVEIYRRFERYNFAGKRLKSKSGWESFDVDEYDGEIKYAYGPVLVKDGDGYSVTVEVVDYYDYNYVDSVLVTGTDDYGFSALPGGRRGYYGRGNFHSVGNYGSWWSASGDHLYMSYREDMMNYDDPENGLVGISVRCVVQN
jgi:uncharacterized protein (TIGR02145 family)